ncbi:MAG TPA: phage holin family protein [Brevundimonas sp.]|uniref:phage holin family protein n=1 Tax=Brevundimonas sp. TaxID=1871086 RepID=UPI002EDB1009
MAAQDKPIGSLLQDAAGDIGSIVRNEARLAQAEIKENLHRAMTGAISALLGAVVLIPALTLLLFSLAYALDDYDVVPRWAAALIAAAVGAVIGAILLARAKAALKPAALAPSRTADNLKQDAQLVKEQVR